jgi:hypothetical protein
MEFSQRHHDTLTHGGIDRQEVATQAPLLADTMRQIVNAILRWEKHVMLSSYNKKKRKESKKEKKFPIPEIADLPHKERKHLSKNAFHDALEFRSIDLKRDRIEWACREIRTEYRWTTEFSENKLWKDAKLLVWSYFLFRKIDGRKSFLSILETIIKNPNTWAFEGKWSNILPTLKVILQATEAHKAIDYKKFTKALTDYAKELFEKYREVKVKK